MSFDRIVAVYVWVIVLSAILASTAPCFSQALSSTSANPANIPLQSPTQTVQDEQENLSEYTRKDKLYVYFRSGIGSAPDFAYKFNNGSVTHATSPLVVKPFVEVIIKIDTTALSMDLTKLDMDDKTVSPTDLTNPNRSKALQFLHDGSYTYDLDTDDNQDRNINVVYNNASYPLEIKQASRISFPSNPLAAYVIISQQDKPRLGLDTVSIPLTSSVSIDNIAIPGTGSSSDPTTLGQALTYKFLLGNVYNDSLSNSSHNVPAMQISISFGAKGVNISQFSTGTGTLFGAIGITFLGIKGL